GPALSASDGAACNAAASLPGATPPVDCGTFTTNLPLTPGSYRLAATQTLGARTSDLSARISFSVVDPGAPRAPTGSTPAAPVPGTGDVQVSGTAQSNATITVTVPGGDGTTTTLPPQSGGSFNVDVQLTDPGSYQITVTQTVGGSTSAASAPIAVKVPLPPLT